MHLYIKFNCLHKSILLLVISFYYYYNILIVIYNCWLQRIIDNGMGSKNNLVTVKKSDFEVFQALAMDSESISSNQQSKFI